MLFVFLDEGCEGKVCDCTCCIGVVWITGCQNIHFVFGIYLITKMPRVKGNNIKDWQGSCGLTAVLQ